MSFEIRVGGEHLFDRVPCRKESDDRADGDAHPTDTRSSSHDFRIVSDSRKKVSWVQISIFNQ